MIVRFFSDQNREFFRNHIVQWLFAFSFLVNILLWIACAWFFRPGDESITLRFNAYLGVDPLSMGMAWYTPYQIPLVSGMFLCIQMALSWWFFRRQDRIVAHLMVFCGGIIQCFACIALWSVVLINR